MTNILLVTSSPRDSESISTKIATELASKLQATSPGSRLVVRDLVKTPLPHIAQDYASGIYLPAEARNAAQSKVVDVSDAAVEELQSADHVVLATGLINFSISSTLKSWIDHISRSGLTFRYGENGPEGLVKNKKLYLVIASGGIYSEGPSAVYDFAVPYLRGLFGFLGVTDFEVIRIEGVGMGEEAIQKGLTSARNRIDELVAKAGEATAKVAA